MKILYISHLHPPYDAIMENMGGMQRVSMQLVDILEKRQDIELDTVTLEAPWRMAGPRTAWFLINQLFDLPVRIRQAKPDVVLFSSMVTASLAYFIRNKVKVPMVTINHGQDVTMPVPAYQKFLPGVFDSLDGVISVSRATREKCIERGMAPEKGIALPNGISIEEDFLCDKDTARRKLENLLGCFINEKFLLLTVGRQVRRKGHQWFIEKVLPIIQSDVFYLVIGDGPEHQQIKQSVQHSRKKEHILLAGRMSDEVLKYAYTAADLFMMPNIPVPGDMEGFGVVLLEANFRGTPAIASDLEGIKDVIKQGENGYRVSPADEAAFATKVDEVLNNELEILSERARNYVSKTFTWDAVIERYLDFLDKIIDRYNYSQNYVIYRQI